jgi:hypothetical protein
MDDLELWTKINSLMDLWTRVKSLMDKKGR